MSLKPVLTAVLLVASASLCRATPAARVFEAMRASVVLISNEEGTGSGVIISPDGLILTNLHVVSTPLPLSVTVATGQTETKVFAGQVIKVHKSSDLALLKITPGSTVLAPARLAKSAAECKPGSACYALGFPFLPGQTTSQLTITNGIVNSFNREIEGQPYIQFDATIRPGNSGGALVNENGVLTGVPTMRYAGGDRVGMAIPVIGLKMDDFVDVRNRKGDPAKVESLVKMANSFLEQGNRESVLSALQIMQQALALEPKNAQHSVSIARIYQRLGFFPLALSYAESANRIQPDNLQTRLLLAEILKQLKRDDDSIRQLLACLPLLKNTTEQDAKKLLFKGLIESARARGDAVRALYLVSWSRAMAAEPSGMDHSQLMKQIAKVVTAEVSQSILAKTSGHTTTEMEQLARANPVRLPAEKPGEQNAPADVTKVQEASVANATIHSKVEWKNGDKSQLVDAPAGVIYKEAEGLLEWTPPPFSNVTEAKILFLVTHADGSEETYIHTISRTAEP